MQCVILAGGLGTRMRPMSGTTPKWLLPVAGRPFAEWQLDWLAGEGIERIVVAASHLAGKIERFVQTEGQRWPIGIQVSDEGPEPRGTGGALRHAINRFDLTPGFFVLYGDSYLQVNFRAVWQASGSGTTPVMTVYKNDGRWDASNARVENGAVTLYEKGHPNAGSVGMAYIDYGLSVLPEETVRRRIPDNAEVDLADLMRTLSTERGLLAFEASERFYEIGSPEGLRDLEKRLGGT